LHNFHIINNNFINIYIAGTVHLSKVKFNANQEFEYIQNFKILQAAFQKNSIDKVNFFFFKYIKYYHNIYNETLKFKNYIRNKNLKNLTN